MLTVSYIRLRPNLCIHIHILINYQFSRNIISFSQKTSLVLRYSEVIPVRCHTGSSLIPRTANGLSLNFAGSRIDHLAPAIHIPRALQTHTQDRCLIGLQHHQHPPPECMESRTALTVHEDRYLPRQSQIVRSYHPRITHLISIPISNHSIAVLYIRTTRHRRQAGLAVPILAYNTLLLLLTCTPLL